MRRIISKPFVVFHAMLLGLAALIAQQTPPADPPQGQPEDPAPSAAAAIAESGLLPMYGMALELDKSWVDGKKFPNPTPVSDAFQQLYDTHIAPCGVNLLRVPFDVNDGKAEESTRLANMLVWAQSKGVKVGVVLAASEVGKAFPKDYASRAKTFVSSVISALKRNKAANLAAYSQIAFYQLSHSLNQPANHGVVDPAAAAESLKKAAADIRAAETTALAEAGIAPAGLMISASFDFELLKGGAMVGTELKPETFTAAFESLKTYLAPFADSVEIGMVSIEWFPGSVSSDATDKLADLVRGLMADVQGKLLVLNTGFSTGFRTHEDQSRYYALAFANLADLRASEGVDCPFTGVIWNAAIDGAQANANPPSDQTAANIGQWDLTVKAAEIVKMWQEGGGDPDLQWWWNKTRSSFGVLAGANGSLTPKQAHEVLTELQGATAQAAVESGVAETVQKIEEVQVQAAEAGVDPNAAPPVDPNTGQPIDPNAGQPIDPNNPPIDPNTGLPITTGAVPSSNPFQPVMDDLKSKLNGALGELLGGIIEKGKMGLSNLIGKILGGGPGLGSPGFDPNAGGAPPIDPNTGLPIDPNTGLPIDPNNPPIDPNTGLPVTGGGDPGAGGGVPPGPEPGRAPTGADLGFESPPAPLGSMTTNVPINLTVAIKNNGDIAAEGATAYLVDGEGNAFAASEPKTVEPGASASAEIVFTPPSAGSIAGVKVQLFCDNESESRVTDNFADVGSISISDPAGGVDEGLPGGSDPGGSDPGGVVDPGGTAPGGGITPGGGRPGGLRPGGLRPGIITGIRPILPTLVGLKPPLGITVRNPGIVPKLSLIKPGMFNVSSLTPASSARLMQALSADASGGPSSNPIGFQAGQSVPLNIPITNPFRRPFMNVKATLFVNGQSIATRSLGSVMSKQTRTISFGEFKPDKAGNYRTEVRFEAIGRKGKPTQGKVAGDIRVLDPTTGKAMVRPNILAPTQGAAPTTPGGALVPRPTLGMMPTIVRPNILRPNLLNIGGLVRPGAVTPGVTRPGATLPGTTRPLIGGGIAIPVIRALPIARGGGFTLLSENILLNPFPPASGAQVSVAVQLKNPGTSAIRSVKVEAFLDGKSLKAQTIDLPPGQQGVATGFDKFPAAVGSHSIRVVTTLNGQTQEATRNFDVRTGVILTRPILAIPLRASLAFTGNDIQLSPIPQPDRPTSISINVRNPGSLPAANAEFEAFADGRSLGKVTKTIGPLQTQSISGFPTWTSPAGSHVIKVVASIAGRQIMAEKSVNVATLMIARPIIARPAVGVLRPGGLAPLVRPGGVTPGGTTPGGTTPGGISRPTVSRPGTVLNPGLITRPAIGAAGPDMGIAVSDLSVSPPNPQPDQDVTLHARVHNFGQADAVAAMVTFSYQVDNQAPKTMTLPVTVKAGQELPRSWKVRLPAGRALAFRVSVTHKDDKNPNNAMASLNVPIGGANPPPGGISRPIITPPGGTAPGGITPTLRPGTISRPGIVATGSPDLALAGPDITFTPSSPKEGDTLTFTIRVRNVGQAEAAASKLSLVLKKDGTQHETRDLSFNAKAGEQATLTYSVRVPNARQLVLTATAQHPNDKNPGNGQASATVNVTQSLAVLPRPGIGLRPPLLQGAPDLALGMGSVVPSASSIKQGGSLKFTVKVKNQGRGDAKGAVLTIRIMVDGKLAGSQTFTLDVGAGRTEERSTGLRSVPAGKRVECQASVTVAGDSNGGNNSGGSSVPIG